MTEQEQKAFTAMREALNSLCKLALSGESVLWTAEYDAARRALTAANTVSHPQATEPNDFSHGYDIGYEAGKLHASQATEPAWRPIESAPKLTQVLIFYRNLLGNGRTVKARFVPRFSEECGDFDESEHVREYDEKGDCFTLIEGWYEQIDNWDDFSEVYISGVKPTHWMPLPSPPEAHHGK